LERLDGELDLETAPTLTSALHSLERPCERVVVDVSGLQFIDSTGLHLAVEEHQRATTDGFEFVIAGAGENVLRVLRIAGLDVGLPLAPDGATGHRRIGQRRRGTLTAMRHLRSIDTRRLREDRALFERSAIPTAK
jgi:anti-sigma B factor antagonist